MNKMQNQKLVHSPHINYAIGEPFILDGKPAIRLQRKDKVEEITAVDYMELIFGKEIWSLIFHAK